MKRFRDIFQGRKGAQSRPEIQAQTETSFRILGEEIEPQDDSADEIDIDAWFAEAEHEYNERRRSPTSPPAIPWEEQQKGIELVRDAKNRDLDRAEKILARLWDTTNGYEPGFCAYADLFYMRGEYERSAAVALEAHQRATTSPEWMENPPPAPLRLAAKAYRALARQAKKAGNLDAAGEHYRRIIDLGQATDNDIKLWSKLEIERPGS